jgi:hypothetical protein
MTEDCYGPLPLEEMLSPPAPHGLALHADDGAVLEQHDQQI